MLMAFSLKKSGYRMPAEWAPHEATWIAWPHNKEDWPGKFGPIAWVYADIVRLLHHGERVRILVNGGRIGEYARDVLQKSGVDLARIDFYPIRTNRVWTRDYGPIFVQDSGGALAITDWKFSAWAKYPDWQRDNAVPSKIARALKLRSVRPKAGLHHVVLEGGSIDVNGEGLLLTTEECLLSSVQARNPDLTRAELEQALMDYLGVRKVLWLNRGIAGDDTHGHVDDLARFVGPRTVVTVGENNPTDANYEPLQENLERLRGMTDLDGKALEIVTLPMPNALYFDGQRLPASYANFYIANDRVLVPTFNDPRDRIALGILADLFPTRQVVGVHAGRSRLGAGHVALHDAATAVSPGMMG
jgi:agmatine deiminase